MDRLERMNSYLNYISENGRYRNPYGIAWYLIDLGRVLRNQPADDAAPLADEEEQGGDPAPQVDPDLDKMALDRSKRIKQTILLAVMLLSTFILFIFVVTTIQGLVGHPFPILWPGGLGPLNF